MRHAGLRPFPGTDRVLAAQASRLPQPDHLCGAFAGHAALHALLAEVPSMLRLAHAAGTAVWPEDDDASLPPGAVPDRTGWEQLPWAGSAEESGTTASGLGEALEAAGAAVTPVPLGPDRLVLPGPTEAETAVGDLLAALAGADLPFAVVANLRTGPVLPPGMHGWDVGHFVVLWGLGERPAGDRFVGVADSYRQLGQDGLPAGCRLVDLPDLVRALAAPPGRGLLLLSRPADRARVRRLVEEAGLGVGGWD